MEFQTVLENRRSVRSYRMPTTRNTLCEFLELSRCSPNLSRKEVLSDFSRYSRKKGTAIKIAVPSTFSYILMIFDL